MELSEMTILVGSNPNLVCVFCWRRDTCIHVSRIAALSFPASVYCARKQKGILAADTTRLRALLCSLHSVSYLSFGSALLDIYQISSNSRDPQRGPRLGQEHQILFGDCPSVGVLCEI